MGEFFDTSFDTSEELTKLKTLLQKKDNEIELIKIDHEIIENTLKVLGNNSDKILVKGNRHWMNFSDVRKLFKTTTPRLNQAFEDIARSDLPLFIEEDFDDIEDQRYYSFSGLERIGNELSNTLTRKSKALFVNRAKKKSPDQIQKVYSPILPSEQKITSAMTQARTQQNKVCQVTGESDPKLAVHHLYDKSTYPELAIDQDNLILIKEPIHHNFHAWNEGFDKPCTINDFISYIKTMQPEFYEHIAFELDKRQLALQTKLKYRSKFKPLEPASTKSIDTESPKNKITSQESINRNILGKTTFANINNEQVEGKILAISTTYGSDQKPIISLCFQKKEHKYGIWLPSSAFINQ